MHAHVYKMHKKHNGTNQSNCKIHCHRKRIDFKFPSMSMKYEFLEPLPDDFKCPVCLDAVYDAVETKCCGHHLCGQCSDRLTGACPLCKEPQLVTRESMFMRRQLRQRHIYCINKNCSNRIYNNQYPANPNSQDSPSQFSTGSNCCNWSGEINDLQSHLEICPHAIVACQYNCGFIMARCQKEDHEDKICRKRPFSCWFCGMKATAKEIDGHAIKCDKRPIECPNKCPAELLQGELQLHLKQCPLQEVSCEFKHAGCKERISRKDYDSHITDTSAMISHLRLLSSSVAEQAATQKRNQEHFEEEKQKQVACLEEVRQQLQCLNKQLQEEKSKYKQTSEEKIELCIKELQKNENKLRILSHMHLQSISITVPHKSLTSSALFYIQGYCMSVKIDRMAHTAILMLHPGQYDDDLTWPLEGVVTLVLIHPKDIGKNILLEYHIKKAYTARWVITFKRELGCDSKDYIHQNGGMNKEYKLSVKSATLNN